MAHNYNQGTGLIGCFTLLVIMALCLSLGFGVAALLTWLVSLLGVITFSWTNAIVVWGIIIILGIIFSN